MNFEEKELKLGQELFKSGIFSLNDLKLKPDFLRNSC